MLDSKRCTRVGFAKGQKEAAERGFEGEGDNVEIQGHA